MKQCINKAWVLLICLTATVVFAQDNQTASAPAPAPAKETKDYISCLAAWDTILNTLQTHFTQQTQYDGLLISQSQGRIAYMKNGSKLRLDNVEENQITQTALTNKKQIYIFDEKGKEISKISWAEWLAGQPNQALFDFGNYTALLQKHKVALTRQDATQATLRLEPKTQEKNTYTLYITLQQDNCFPISISVQSDLMTTIATLENTQLNQSLEADTFKRLK